MIDTDGYFDWASLAMPGRKAREDEFGPSNHDFSVIIHHSMESNYHPFVYWVPYDPQRFPTSWHGTVTKDGTLYQHHDLRLRLQHAHAGNVKGPGFEAEGFAGEPLTKAQEDTYIRIHTDINEWMAYEYTRENGGLAEHNEVAGRNVWGSKKTQCPSGRYDGLWKRLEEPEPDFDFQEWKAHVDRYLDGLNDAAWTHQSTGSDEHHQKERP